MGGVWVGPGLDPLQVALSLGAAFVSTCGVLIAATALGARWFGRPEADREMADAQRYRLDVLQHPDVVEYTALNAVANAYRANDRYYQKELDKRGQLADQARDEVDARSTLVRGYGEALNDAEAAAARLLPLIDRPRGVRGALRRVLRGVRRSSARPGRGRTVLLQENRPTRGGNRR